MRDLTIECLVQERVSEVPAPVYMLFAILLLGALLVLEPARAADIEFVTQELPWAIADKDYSPPPLESRHSGACPLAGVSYAVVSGELPPGLRLSRLGYFSGRPKHTGSTDFTVRVSNGCTWAARRFTLVVAGAPVLKVLPAALIFDGTAGDQVLQVSASWPDLAYQATTNAEWLKVKPEYGVTRGAQSNDIVHVSIDASKLKPGRYSGSITFSAWQAANVPAVPVELTLH